MTRFPPDTFDFDLFHQLDFNSFIFPDGGEPSFDISQPDQQMQDDLEQQNDPPLEPRMTRSGRPFNVSTASITPSYQQTEQSTSSSTRSRSGRPRKQSATAATERERRLTENRRERNRLAAKRSRMKRINYITGLEEALVRLQDENNTLRLRIATLSRNLIANGSDPNIYSSPLSPTSAGFHLSTGLQRFDSSPSTSPSNQSISFTSNQSIPSLSLPPYNPIQDSP